jgi:hypothetical protein
MKTIVSALIALSLLAGISAPANAIDAKGFFEEKERLSGGSTQAVDSKTLWDQAERAMP